jgi:hypothetical protein
MGRELGIWWNQHIYTGIFWVYVSISLTISVVITMLCKLINKMIELFPYEYSKVPWHDRMDIWFECHVIVYQGFIVVFGNAITFTESYVRRKKQEVHF